jgi:hypothetical protein
VAAAVQWRPDGGRYQAAVAAVEDWLLCPCVDHVEAIVFPPDGRPSSNLGCSVLLLTKAPTANVEQFNMEDAVQLAVAAGFEQNARDVVRQELLPWALGTSDPVRERVEARRREAASE